ncbi:winged helix-turn-helix transcriptional regulator [Methanocella conradii]|uniref:winged helix-turn-helix transcriptional regulator n=1 Tax=Methanocella conradii TaxID=1175444 RepID=UPI0024B32727|nr:winged helix-turn-helix transcriptional regulator [Methanocella conradii]MDI6898023.1 winged helix-turn-helix transcriptional regulator [Methanocella conradii]
MALAIDARSCLKNVRLLELILSVFLIISIVLAYAEDKPGDLIFVSGYDVNLAHVEMECAGESDMDRQLSFFDLPFWVQMAYLWGSIRAILGSLIIFPGAVRKGRGSLTNETRESIIDFISKNPGCRLSHIIKKENLPRSTVRYHVAKLKSEGKVIFKSVGKSLRVFISSRPLSDKEKTVAAYAHNETDRTILYLMFESEGLTSQYISGKLNISKSAVYKHLKKYLG